MEPISRRTLLTGACAILALGAAPIPAVANNQIKKLSDGRVSVQVRSVPGLSKIGGVVSIGDVKGRPVALARTGASTYMAFSLLCPHQGVTVVRDAKGWNCPAHGSQFEVNGKLVLGPATTNLPRVPAKLSRGLVVVG